MNTAIRKKIGSLLLFTVIWMGTAFGAPMPASEASDGGMTDYDQQAVWLARLALSYVTWPTQTTTSEGVKIINACVVGENSTFTKSLEKIQAGTTRIKINIIQSSDNTDFRNCNIAYIPKNKASYKDTIFNIHNQPVLTISPIHGFASAGGVVELVISEVQESSGGAPINSRSTVNVIINLKAATAANLKIAPELLEPPVEVIR